jgi:hypothetical protein
LVYPWRRPFCDPMRYFHLIDSIPWIGSTIMEWLLMGIMLRRGLVRRFPIFFASLVFDLAREMTFPAVAYYSARVYGYAYWIALPVEYVIGFAVMLEAYRCSVAAEWKITHQTIRLLGTAAIVLAGLAAFLLFHPDLPGSTLFFRVLTLDRSIDFLRCGMLLFLWTFASKLGITWRHHVWGIVFGLGVYAALGLVAAAIHATTGIVSGDWAARLPHFGYLAATILWTAYLWRPEPARGPLTMEYLYGIRYIVGGYHKILALLWRVLDGD